MDFILGIVTGVFLNEWVLLGLVLTAFFCEKWEWHGTALFAGLITAVSAYFYFHLQIKDLVAYAIAYFIVGVFWSFWRYKKFIRREISNAVIESDQDERRVRKELSIAKQVNRVVTWIFIWPLSLIDNVIKSIVSPITEFVKKNLKAIYDKIMDDEFKRATK